MYPVVIPMRGPVRVGAPSISNGPTMAEDNDGRGAPPTHIHVEGGSGNGVAANKTNWLPWILAALGVLALLALLSQCGREDRAVVAPVATGEAVTEPAANPAVAPDAGAATAGALAGTSGLGAYLAGTGALPRSFVFETMYFDTAKSDLRADGRDEVNAIATALKASPNARVRVVGFADARGDAAMNARLGAARANSVKTALVSQGIDAGRIEAASGGEASPADTNATATGQAGNRRTELVALTR